MAFPGERRQIRPGWQWSAQKASGSFVSAMSSAPSDANAIPPKAFGHSHIRWDTTGGTGLRLLNPGSPTDRRRQPNCTYLTATAEAGHRHDVILHAIPR